MKTGIRYGRDLSVYFERELFGDLERRTGLVRLNGIWCYSWLGEVMVTKLFLPGVRRAVIVILSVTAPEEKVGCIPFPYIEWPPSSDTCHRGWHPLCILQRGRKIS